LETSPQPSPEQQAIIAARCADLGGSLRVLAFAGSGKTTALRLLAEADTTPALYIAYNKSTQRAPKGGSPLMSPAAPCTVSPSGRGGCSISSGHPAPCPLRLAERFAWTDHLEARGTAFEGCPPLPIRC
jgi:hypothetical protein